MPDPLARPRFSDRLVSRTGTWVSLGIAVLLMTALFGVLRGTDAPTRGDQAAPDAESSRVAALLDDFPDADLQSVLVVAARDDAATLSPEDLSALDQTLPLLAAHADADPNGPLVSDDGEAAVFVVPVRTGQSGADAADAIAPLRAALSDATPAGLTLQVTGGPAFGTDIASAFDGADLTLLLVTIAIVALLLILTYRSPVLWLVPLAVVALADGVAGRVTAAAGAAWDLSFDAGIISVLVFGAGTNYALLMISRYRDELLRHDDHRTAMAIAWRAAVPAIVASNVTVVVALSTLALAVIPGTRGLGLSSAIGLLIAVVFVLLVLPPLLVVFGRRLFWPFVPRAGAAPRAGGFWHALASRVMRRPVVSLVGGGALLAMMAAGLLGTSVGLDQVEKFRVPSESAAGLEVLSAHFPAGEAQPHLVVTATESVDDVLTAVEGVDGVVRAHPAGATTDGALTRIMVTGEDAPGTPESLAQVAELRRAVHAVPDAGALVGGAVAADADAREGNERDLLVVAPLVLAVSLLVLLILTRSLVAPFVLLVVNTASALAAIGAGAWLSRVVFDQHALDLQVPLLAFLFLVALGIDYTIFLVHRAREEAGVLGTRGGMVQAVARTGGVITSAGIVLAAVFAALGVLPLVTLGQLGLIVGVGVVVDTLVVRTVIVPAVFALLGERVWWPSRPAVRAEDASEDVVDVGSS